MIFGQSIIFSNCTTLLQITKNYFTHFERKLKFFDKTKKNEKDHFETIKCGEVPLAGFVRRDERIVPSAAVGNSDQCFTHGSL